MRNDGRRNGTTIDISPALARRLARIGADEGLPLPTFVESALRECANAYTAARAPRHVRDDAIFYAGPSLLTGDEIVGVFTGLDYVSQNPKTGPVIQTWILRRDMAPMEAVRQNRDDAICGDCALRGDHGSDRRCYVPPWLGPNNVYRVAAADTYDVLSWADAAARVSGHSLRLGAYGDPAAIPFEVWTNLLQGAAGWVGYTHQWHRCDPRFKTIVMASVDNLLELRDARAHGWRTFRVVARGHVSLVPGREIVCPASAEAGHRTTCERCQLCRGTSRPARSIAIAVHGHNGVQSAFYRSRQEALVCA